MFCGDAVYGTDEVVPSASSCLCDFGKKLLRMTKTREFPTNLIQVIYSRRWWDTRFKMAEKRSSNL